MFEKITSTLRKVIGEKHEVPESIREALKDRVTSPFYGYFIISWLLVNWNYLYTALFVGGEEILERESLLRDEYLLQEVLPVHYKSWTYWIDFLILPFVITCVVFWFMPFLTRIFLRQHIRNKIKNEKIRNKELEAEIKSETKVLQAEVEQAKVEKEAEKISPELNWKRDYNMFKSSNLYKSFDRLIDSVYKYNGLISTGGWDAGTGNWEFSIPQDLLVYIDINGIVTKKGNKIELTPKGREFIRLYTADSK